MTVSWGSSNSNEGEPLNSPIAYFVLGLVVAAVIILLLVTF